MDTKRHCKSFPRVWDRLPRICFGAVAVFMIVAVIDSLTDRFTTWKLPVWRMSPGAAIFVTAFMLFWFGFVGSFARMLILGLETVDITREEVRIRIGPLVVRRMPLSEIKTVVSTGYSTRRLVLTNIPAEELREMSLSLEQKRLQKRQMQRMSSKDKDPATRIKRYMHRNFLKNRLWLEYSEEAEEALRKYLTTTVFIV